jgi:hypothetical protein
LAVEDAVPSIVAFFNRVDAIADQFGPDSAIVPLRIRAFAEGLVLIADLFDRFPRTPAGLAEMERLAEGMGINAAWREFGGMREKKSPRFMLLDCIDMVAPAAPAVREGRAIKAILSCSFPATYEYEYELLPTPPDPMVGLASLARMVYGLSFPVQAAKVDLERLAIAINAWNKGPGAPKKGTSSKWSVILDFLVSVGLADATMKSETLAEHWSDYKKAARGRWMPRVLRFE